jgi:hypothetical protein
MSPATATMHKPETLEISRPQAFVLTFIAERLKVTHRRKFNLSELRPEAVRLKDLLEAEKIYVTRECMDMIVRKALAAALKMGALTHHSGKFHIEEGFETLIEPISARLLRQKEFDALCKSAPKTQFLKVD